MEKRLRWYEHLTINLFWLGLNIRNNAVGALFLPYLVDMFVRDELKNTSLGALRTAGLVVAMLVQPAAGLLSDRSTSRFGRRRPFIVAGVLLDLLLLAAIYFSWDYPSLLAAVLLFQISSNLSHGPLQALIPDMVPPTQRGIASGIKAIFELLPLIFVGFTIAALVGQGHLDHAVIATGAALLLTMLVTVLLVKEQPLQEKPPSDFAPQMMRVLGMLAGIGIGALAGLVSGAAAGGLAALLAWFVSGPRAAEIVGVSLAGLVAMVVAVIVGVYAGVRATLGRSRADGLDLRQPFSWWMTNRLLFLAAITSIQGFAPFFLMYAFNIDRDAAAGLTGQLMTMVGIFTLVTALPGGWLSDRFGHLRMIGLSGLAAAAGSFLLLGTIWVPNIQIIYVVGGILGLSTGLFVTTNWALGTRLVPAGMAGHYLGVSNLAGAGAGMIGSGIGGPVADYLNNLTPGLGYFVIFACYGLLFVLSVVSLRWIREVPAQIRSGVPLGPLADHAST